MPPTVHTDSTRAITRKTGVFTRNTPRNRSLERGLLLLRAFLPGSPSLSNAELAKRTKLPRPTVSRLTHSLVKAGFLNHDPHSGLYQLAPVFLSLSLAFRYGKTELNLALPLMRKVATTEKVNIGLGSRDGLRMVYLDTVREGHAPITRIAASGTSLAIEKCSGGLAYLAALPRTDRELLLLAIAPKYGARWPEVRRGIGLALAQGRQAGYYRSDATPGIHAIARIVHGPDGTLYAVNLSVSARPESDDDVDRHGPALIALTEEIERAWLPIQSML